MTEEDPAVPGTVEALPTEEDATGEDDPDVQHEPVTKEDDP